MKYLNRIIVIQEIIKALKAKTYLEIGVAEGICFLKIKTRKKIGVDPEFLISTKDNFEYYIKNPFNFFNEYYEMTSDDFFKLKSNFLTRHGLEVVFVDGLHAYDQSLKDVNHALKYLKAGGVIIMHDCNPPSAAAAYPANSYSHAKNLNLAGWTGEWCGDVWKTIVYLRSNQADLNIFVLDCDYGLGIIAEGKPENMLKYSAEEIQNMTYNDLEKDRTNLLNLKKQEYFEEFLKKIRSGRYQ